MAGRAIVIGGGGIGVASGYYLRQAGWDVTLIDRGQVGQGCSFKNACLIVPSHSDPIPGPGVIGQALRWMLRKDSPFYVRARALPGLLRWGSAFRRHCNEHAAEAGFRALLTLSRASLELYEELLASEAVRFFFERSGLLEVFLTEAGCEEGRRAERFLTGKGFESRLLTPEEARALEPALSPAIRGALFTKGEAHGLSYGYVRSLAARLEKCGGAILENRPVREILTTRSGSVSGVALGGPDEELGADLVVLAAGSWSAALAKPLGITLPLQPAKGYSSTIDAYDGGPKLPILIKERRVIVTPLDTRLRFAGTLELTGFDDTVDPTRYAAVVRAGREVLATEPPMLHEERWSGLRPVTPDGLPIIGRAPGVEGLILATGHAMLGFTQSPITGKLVAEIADGGQPSVPLEPFRLERF